MKKLALIALSGLMLFSCAACGTTTPEEKIGVDIPEGYTAEVGENMFWEPQDRVKEGYIEPNARINIYNYCPSIIQTDDTTRYVWYCTNRYTKGFFPSGEGMDELGDNQITDYVGFRKGLLGKDGKWYWSPKSYVMGPSRNDPYEGEANCDPNVIKGEFRYNGTQYGWLMAYLGSNTRDGTMNHICFAVAHSVEGPWLKCEDINPVVKYEVPADATESHWYHWGYGQASMINVDKKSEVLMFYSAIRPMSDNGITATNPFGDSSDWPGTITVAARYDLSDLNDIKLEFCSRIGVDGIKNTTGMMVGTITNGDYAYDGANKRLVALTEETVSMLDVSNDAVLGDVFKDYAYNVWAMSGISWKHVAVVQPENKTVYPNRHNNGLVRDPYGWLVDSKKLDLAITGAPKNAANGVDHIWGYRILRKTVTLP